MTHQTRWRGALPVLAVVVLASCNPDSPSPTGLPSGLQPGSHNLAPLIVSKDAMPERYVVVLKDGAGDGSAMSRDIMGSHSAKVHHEYRAALRGFAATLSPAAVDALRRNPLVKYVAADVMMYPSVDQANPPSWGLDRIDQRSDPLNSKYTYTKTGTGVNVYIIDTGIRTSHTQFGSRAVIGTDFTGGTGQDCNGHGTHVAGTVAGSTMGVAKAARVIAVRVFGCSGGTAASTVIAAIDWVTADVKKAATDPTKVGGLPAVANLSLGGGFFEPTNTAIQNMINARVVAVVAAGNEDQNACNVSPASAPAAITVGASTLDDQRSWFSNWGTCVDIFAPGSGIVSAWFSSNTATQTLSGTSMAAPHVAGVAALYLQGRAVTTRPAAVRNVILNSSTTNQLGFLRLGSPNALLYSRLTASTMGLAATQVPLSIVFVRAAAATSSIASAEPDTRQLFKSSGAGSVKLASDDELGTVRTATTATTLSANLLITNVKSTTREWEVFENAPWASLSPTNGSLAPDATTFITTTVNSSSLAVGMHGDEIQLTDVTGGGATDIPLSVEVVEATALLHDVARSSLAGAADTRKWYMVTVPAGMQGLTIALSGGSGDADLYVRYGQAPDFLDYDCRPFVDGNNESCSAEFPAAGTYYVMLHGFFSYSGASLKATIMGKPAAPTTLGRTVVSSTRIDLTWTDASVNEENFKLYRRTRDSDLTWGAWGLIATRAKNTTTYSNTGLVAATTYQYRIRACNTIGCSAFKNSTTATSPP
jgi:subtilisin family serine protease